MAENHKDIETKNEEYNKGRSVAMFLGALVYFGVVGAATLLFISFVLSAFPAKAYVSRLIMTVAGALVGGSMIAFPVALHLWAVEKWHRIVTIILYFLELCVIAVNTVVAFAHLLSKNAGLASPEWVVLYEPFSIGAIIYTLFAWGIVFLMDPAHKRKAKELQNEEKFAAKVAEREAQFLDSIEGEDVIQEVAEMRVREKFNAGRFRTGTRHWGSGKKALPESDSSLQLPEPRTVEISEDVYKQLLQDAGLSYPVQNPTHPPR